VSGIAGTFLRFRAGLAAKRRHPGLMHFEDTDMNANEADQVAKINADRARIRARRKELTKEVNSECCRG